MIIRKIVVLLLVIYALASATIVTLAFLGVSIPPIVTILMTVLAFTFSILHGSIRLGWWRTLLFVALTFTVSLTFESIGVATGLVYGPYHYTDRLGPQFLGLVPYIIPLAWFMMMYPSWIIAERLVPTRWKPWQRSLVVAAIGALVMTAWDLALDPFMVTAGHWVWEVEGAYFGVPLQNYWGWWLTALITLGLFIYSTKPSQLQAHVERGQESGDLPVYSYGTTGLSSILTNLNLGLGGPALAGFFAMLPWVVLALFSTDSEK